MFYIRRLGPEDLSAPWPNLAWKLMGEGQGHLLSLPPSHSPTHITKKPSYSYQGKEKILKL